MFRSIYLAILGLVLVGVALALDRNGYIFNQVQSPPPKAVVTETLRERAEKFLVTAVSKDPKMPSNAQIKDTHYFTSSIVFANGSRVPNIHTVCGVAEQTLPTGKILARKFVATVAFSPNDVPIPKDSTLISWDSADRENATCKDLVANRGF